MGPGCTRVRATPVGWATVMPGDGQDYGMADGSTSRCSRRLLHAGHRGAGGRV